MSSGSSGRYQSRLFNFVHQQSRRLTQQWESSFRHLQVATKRGVGVLLYPIYLLFQSTESAGKALHTKEPQSRLQLQSNDTDFQPENPPNADTPIQRLLEAVESLPSAESVATPEQKIKNGGWGRNLFKIREKLQSPADSELSQSLVPLRAWWQKFFHHPTTKPDIPQSLTITDNSVASLNQHFPVVRGIATNLVNRHLVLVAANNDILDILTPQQQAKLEDKIISEVADYWHYWQLTAANKATELLPEIDRLLTKLTGENTANTPALAEGTPKYLLRKDKVIALLDTAVAKLEVNAIRPIQQHSQELVRVAQTQLNIFMYGQEQLGVKREIAVADGLETQKINFQALIEAALNYFFGVSKNKTLESKGNHWQKGNPLPHHSYSVLPKSSQLEPENLIVADPWLNWNDLFGDSQMMGDKLVKPYSRKKPALTNSPSQVIPPPQKPNRNLKSNQKTSKKVNSGKQTKVSSSSAKTDNRQWENSQMQFHQSNQVEAAPDWIETTATLMGYEKHLLEQLLEWLDRAMLWLEKIFVNMLHFLQGLLGVK
ncbi:hypothetical protein I8751_21205 [Nostocaceae cyanobacterium CENA357]|uniref:Uncharacterized protein n=1 Tax=Atlanticothrix silvestris CENA357 TaxID=1725252 RepID=A0A8J7HKP8_9CYAN|nr:hypothetical protein [Atlanticothrix silvestris]MBH8554824.1 hypothetical protein [Atlanticothrix silvestris CENA357]